jgi:hypothetical protein
MIWPRHEQKANLSSPHESNRCGFADAIDVGNTCMSSRKRWDTLYHAARKIRCAMTANTRAFSGIRRLEVIGPLLLVMRMEIPEALPIEGSDITII